MKRMTVAIPTHEMVHREFFLTRCLDSLWNQTFQDFDIVVTDNSNDDLVESICKWYGSIEYYQNPRKGMAQNTNEAIKRSEGGLIKILYMDDFMAHRDALKLIYDNFVGRWMVTGCIHTTDGWDRFNPHIPKYTLDIQNGVNTIGAPSVLTMKNDHPLLFDEEMTWMLDCDLYKRLYDERGYPTILEDLNVVIGIGNHQTTNILSDELKLKEHEYITNKHG